jgi:sporulation-control protein spo0M
MSLAERIGFIVERLPEEEQRLVFEVDRRFRLSKHWLRQTKAISLATL